MSTNFAFQKQNHIHNISNQARVILKRLRVHNLSKLCYSIIRCTLPFQTSSPQHTQMLLAIHGLFYQRKVQIISHIHPWGTNYFFIAKYKIYMQISYMFALYKMRIMSTNHDSINSKWAPIHLNRSCSIH